MNSKFTLSRLLVCFPFGLREQFCLVMPGARTKSWPGFRSLAQLTPSRFGLPCFSSPPPLLQIIDGQVSMTSAMKVI